DAMIRADESARRGRRGITLTECLIGIMIMGVGLVSIATLFPIGLLRLREAQRQSRSALLFESAASDMAARNLVASDTFQYADLLNKYNGLPWWYPCQLNAITPTGSFNPLIQDASGYGQDLYDNNLNLIGLDASNIAFNTRGASGLPFAYDPLWRYKVVAPGNPVSLPGLYLHDTVGGAEVPEARFGSGLGFVRPDPSDDNIPSAHGLQRLSNFNGRIYNHYTDSQGTIRPMYVMPSTTSVPAIFVSPEDIVWNDPTNPSWSAADKSYQPNRSPVLPDHTVGQTQLDISNLLNSGILPTDQTPVQDWRYSWMFTGKLSSASNGSTFEGDLVICENRPFDLQPRTAPITGTTILTPADETVVEGVFGYSRSVATAPGFSIGYGAAADRTVLLRWSAGMEDPIVKIGSWICDVTYERVQVKVWNPSASTGRFLSTGADAAGNPIPIGIPNVLNGGKWDNLPAQRAFWYQVVKVGPPITDPQLGANYRSMVVQVGSRLRSRTPLDSTSGLPTTVNAVLIAPHVVNVIPQTIVIH
uniref:type IV pilus modification PilV family protein n=1 Tax=Paludisphaera rhizosphaerae TaxID=2711216 RepID=UPI0013EC2265